MPNGWRIDDADGRLVSASHRTRDDAAGAARDWQRRALKNATGNRDRLELDCSVYQEPRPCNCDWEQNEQCEECRWSVVDDPRKPEAGQ